MMTSNYRLPGRLRLRFPQLKRDACRIGAVTADMRALPGVVSVEESPITGSMLIHYDASASGSPTFWADIEAILWAHHLAQDIRGHEVHRRIPATDLGREIIDRLAGVLVDKVIQRSAALLVAALL